MTAAVTCRVQETESVPMLGFQPLRTGPARTPKAGKLSSKQQTNGFYNEDLFCRRFKHHRYTLDNPLKTWRKKEILTTASRWTYCKYVHNFQVDLLLNAALNNLDVHVYNIYPLDLIPNLVDLRPNAALNNLDFLIFQVDLHPNLVDQHPKLQLLPLVLLQKRRRYTGLTHRI